MNWILSIIWPLMLHMITSEAVTALLRGRVDSASIAAVTSIIVIPIAVWMYRNDVRIRNDVSKTEACRNTEEKLRVYAGRNADGKNRSWFGLLCFAAGGILNMAWSGILNLLHIQEVFSNQTQEGLLASQILIQIVGLGMLVPIAEELVFRALIYERMKRALTVKQAVFFSALLFAVYHGNPIQMIFAFPMAIALAAVQEKGKSPLFPVLFHMGSNLTAVIVNMCM